MKKEGKGKNLRTRKKGFRRKKLDPEKPRGRERAAEQNRESTENTEACLDTHTVIERAPRHNGKKS